jgi:hypothetical protein
MALIKNQIFTDEPVEIDGNSFFNCKFIRCTLVYSGGSASTFDTCIFDDPKLSFIGPAGNTMAFMESLMRTPFRPLIERTFENMLAVRFENFAHPQDADDAGKQ